MVISYSLNLPPSGQPPLVGCPFLLIQHICCCLLLTGRLFHLQLEDAPWRGDRDPGGELCNEVVQCSLLGENAH